MNELKKKELVEKCKSIIIDRYNQYNYKKIDCLTPEVFIKWAKWSIKNFKDIAIIAELNESKDAFEVMKAVKILRYHTAKTNEAKNDSLVDLVCYSVIDTINNIYNDLLRYKNKGYYADLIIENVDTVLYCEIDNCISILNKNGIS